MEKFSFGLGVMGLGLLVVFVGLVILIGFIMLLTSVSGIKKPAPKSKKAEASAAPTPVIAPNAAPAVQTEDVPAEVIAAITAAIATVWQGQTGFVVRHVKRISNAPAWNRAGREEQTYSRF